MKLEEFTLQIKEAIHNAIYNAYYEQDEMCLYAGRVYGGVTTESGSIDLGVGRDGWTEAVVQGAKDCPKKHDRLEAFVRDILTEFASAKAFDEIGREAVDDAIVEEEHRFMHSNPQAWLNGRSH